MRFVYCHPLFDERKCAHRFSYCLKCAFEQEGLTLERFDYRGTGEAVGEFADVSMDSIREDLSERVESDRVCLIGLRFGATIAYEYADLLSAIVHKLVLIEPIINGSDYVDYLKRKQHIKDMMTGIGTEKTLNKDFENIEGYKTNLMLVEQIKRINMISLSQLHEVKASIHILCVNNRKADISEVELFASSLKSPANQISIDEIVMPPFWERVPCSDYSELTEKILGYCRE